MSNEPRVLLIDDQWGQADDPMIPSQYGRLRVQWTLESAQSSPGKFSVEQAIKRVRAEADLISVVLLDLSFGDASDRLGVKILQAIRSEYPALPVLIFTSLESRRNLEVVVTCMELGANEFVEKTPSPQVMESILQAYADTQVGTALYGNSTAIRILRARIARIAFSGETSVLVVGESGTGKELVARALHRQGPNRSGPFVPKNCADSDSQLLDSELFGHEKGAFTGSTGRRIGLIEEANGGTLFLDEVADMPLFLQAKLLRALESRTIRRLGGNANINSRFQLVCATNQNPSVLISAGKLREDFFYRVAAVTIQIAPLRDRSDDILVLSDLFLKRFKAKGGASYPGQHFEESFLLQLSRYNWPGNVRELRNVVERSVILSTNAAIKLADFPQWGPGPFQDERPLLSRPLSSVGHRQLSGDPVHWSSFRLAAELECALQAKEYVKRYKGSQWKAEFMRLMYPECKAANAKGFEDLLKRLTQGPWGVSKWKQDKTLADLIARLRG